MKTWRVDAFFPEVKPAHVSQQGCTVPASNAPVAANRGLAELLTRDGIKGKHIGVVKLTLVEIKGGKSVAIPEPDRAKAAAA